MPAIISKLLFIEKNPDEKYSGYVNYTSRKKAVNKEKLSNYNDYMGNPKKSTGVFTNDSDGLNESELEYIKSMFDIAQENNSLLWQDVFSFDNKWLEEQGIYDSLNNELDEYRIKEAIRKSLEYTVEKINIKDSAIWSGAIHRNTKNIHVHVAICEPFPTQERGFISNKVRKTMKSKVINHLLDFDKEYKEINTLLRDNLAYSDKKSLLTKDIEMKKIVNEVVKNLPPDRRHWHYNYNTMGDAKVHLDKLTDYYIKNYKFEEYKELIKKLDKQEKKILKLYGKGQEGKELNEFKKYKENKIKELYTRMGNATLKEIKELYKSKEYNSNNKLALNKAFTKRDINKISNALGNELDNMKNQNIYEKIQREIEIGL